MNIYKEQLLDHYNEPHNWGNLEKPDISVSGNNPLCGDVINLKLKINKGSVKDIRYIAQGCVVSIAAASLLSDVIKGKKITNIKSLTKGDIIKLLGIDLGPNRLKCGLLCLDTLKQAISKYEQGKS